MRLDVSTSKWMRLVLLCAFVGASSTATLAEFENDQIGFAPNHIFEGGVGGENVDVMSGNLSLTIPVGPRFQLNNEVGYQVTLYYNSKIWDHDCGAYSHTEDCPGTIVASDHYGLGFNLHFGRIHRYATDKKNSSGQAYVYRYQTPDGSDHFFCIPSLDGGDPSCNDEFTVDGSSTKVVSTGGNFEAYPGDGTKITFAKQIVTTPTARADIDGWYATRIASVLQPTTVYVDVNYPTTGTSYEQVRISNITDSTGRQVTFDYTGYPDSYSIQMPAFAGSTTYQSSQKATYVFDLAGKTFRDPTTSITIPASKKCLTAIRYPLLNSTTEKYSFGYDGTGDPYYYGYLVSRTLPTGASTTYSYEHYATSDNRPAHSELAVKTLRSGGVDYRWSYTRFGDTLLNDPSDRHDQGAHYAGSNPGIVKVLDPFDNLTVYLFSRTLYSTGECTSSGCPNSWYDGLLNSVYQYVGKEEDSNRLVRTDLYEYTADDGNPLTTSTIDLFEYRANYRVPINARQTAHHVTVPAGGEFAASVQSTIQSDWIHGVGSFGIPVARQIDQYDNGVLYRSTYTDYAPTLSFHDTHHYVEVRDANGVVDSRTDRLYNVNHIDCEIRRQAGAGQSLTSCTSGVTLGAGDVKVSNAYDSTTGKLTSTTLTGGDDSSTPTTAYTYSAGGNYAATKTFGAFAWKALDRTVDFNTGLTTSAHDSAGTETDYDWDDLGRLVTIAPTSPEKATTITYTSLLETHVRQDVDSSNYVESVYLYNDLGRLIEERRRNLGGVLEFRKTEYDIAGHITRKSEWALSGTPVGNLVWTTYNYTLFTDTSSATPKPYPDPLGRVHNVTAPDGATTDTEYHGLATQVTQHGINGPDVDSQGQPILLNPTTTYVNDAFGRLASVYSPGGGADAQYGYDLQDHLIQVDLTDPTTQGHVQTRLFQYNRLGRLTRATNPENGTVEYTKYDSRGNLLEYTDARQNQFINTYDDAGRLTNRYQKIAGQNQYVAKNTYDATTGKLSQEDSYQITNGASVLSSTRKMVYGTANGGTTCSLGVHGYAGLNGRLTQVKATVQPWTQEMTTDYCQNELGLRYLVAYPDFTSSGRTRSRVGYEYANGFPWEVHDLERDIEYISAATYAPGGVVKDLLRGNKVWDQRDLDVRSRPLAFHVWRPTTPTRPPLSGISFPNGQGAVNISIGNPWGNQPPTVLFESVAYSYDGAGNVKAIDSNSYRYDELNRLKEATVLGNGSSYDLAYSYDAFGNMTQQSKAINSGTPTVTSFTVDYLTNRMTSHTGFSIPHTYDENGNMTAVGARWGRTFDGQNRLRQVSDFTVGVLGTYDYDASAYRVHAVTDEAETFYFRDTDGSVLSEFKRVPGDTATPVWDKDYIYAFGKNVDLVKNDNPGVPQRPRASTFQTSGAVTSWTVAWYAVDDPDIQGYKLKRGDWAQPVFVGSGGLSYQDSYTNATSTTKVTYQLKSMDTAGNASDWSPELVVRPLGAAPQAPTIASATPGDRSVLVKWTAPTTGERDDIAGYYIERQTPAGGSDPFSRLNSVPVPDLLYSHIGLSNGTSYRYRIITVDTSGRESGPSGTLDATPVDTVPPAKPVGVVAEAGMSNQSIHVSWSPVMDSDVGTCATGGACGSYNVYRSTAACTPGVPCGTEAFAGTVAASQHEWTDTGLTAGSAYYYRVTSVDTSANQSVKSDQVSARPRHPSVCTPTGFAAAFEIDGKGTSDKSDDVIQVHLTWNGNCSSTSYRVYRAEADSGVYWPIADVNAGTNVYLDQEGTGWDYTYYVVGRATVGSTVEESAATSAIEVQDTFDSNATVV